MMTDSDPYDFRAKYTYCRILVIGRPNTGKTTLLQRVCNTSEDQRNQALWRHTGHRCQWKLLFILFSSAGCLAAFTCIPLYCVFSLQHSPSLRLRHVNFLTQVSFLPLRRNYIWSWAIFMISWMQLHVFHLKWKKCNYIHCSLGMKLRLWMNFRIALSTCLLHLLGRFQASCFPDAVVPKYFTAPGPMEVDSAITYSTLPGSIGFMIDAHSNSHYRHPAMQAHLGLTIIPSAKRLFNLRTLKVFSNGARPDYCAARG